MTVARREVLKILAGCLRDEDQAMQVQELSESVQTGPGLDDASAASLFAAAMGDAESWHTLVGLHPSLASVDANDMLAVIDRLFAGETP